MPKQFAQISRILVPLIPLVLTFLGTVLIIALFVLFSFKVGTGIWQLTSVVFAAGASGGLINALLTDNGFIVPFRDRASSQAVFRFGSLTNIAFGGVAAVISWGLYGPFVQFPVVSSLTPAPLPPKVGTPNGGGIEFTTVSLTLGGLVGALLVGIGGARWITAEVDKRLWAKAASAAAAAPSDSQLVQQLASASPLTALEVAQAASDKGNRGTSP